ncbi:MAG: DNA-3-methyladenine glycosylase [Candidatus Bathyarchaeia archaeon]
MILNRGFYERDALTVAKELLGKLFVHETAEGTSTGRIVETEAYKGPEDKASHAYGGLRTRRTEPQFGPKGHAYIYLVYGMYYCFNVTAGEVAGKPEAVLLRALEPVEGLELMKKRRPAAKGNVINLANGPGKLCTTMGLTKAQNGADLCVPPLHIDAAERVADECIVQTTRIGVDYADEWKHKRWRFYIRDNIYVSVKAKG